MTRKDILAQYKVDKHGVIRNPGKFEGEMLYVPYFWDAFLNGMVDNDDGQVLTFYVTLEDKAEFPELKRRRAIKLYETDLGFICEVSR